MAAQPHFLDHGGRHNRTREVSTTPKILISQGPRIVNSGNVN